MRHRLTVAAGVLMCVRVGVGVGGCGCGVVFFCSTQLVAAASDS